MRAGSERCISASMRLSIPLLLAALTLSTPAQGAARNECVVLLHGLARSEVSMLLIQQILDFHGYRVVNLSYPSDEAPIEALVAHVDRAVALCDGARTHFVTHSLGGILARAWLRDHRPAQMGRVVMLAPPNNGTEIVDRLAEQDFVPGLLAFLAGPAALELGTGAGSVPARLGPVDFELGVIAGDRVINPLGLMIEGPNDGTVSVESTRVEGMADHIVLPATHSLLMNNPVVIAEVLEFLRNGVFDHGITLTGALRKLAQP
jgi:triacylglycerol lipase